MCCPRLSELPPPPLGRQGWPWTEESLQLPATRADGSPLPRVTVVTPSYNQVDFLEETIRSVLLQGYPDLEYIVMDGGSTDGSVEIIQKYAPWLAYWVSEKDGGQADAINKGWRRATGEALTWLNSDDVFLVGAIDRAAIALDTTPQADFVFGNVDHIDGNSIKIGQRLGREFSLHYVLTHWHNIIPQPGFLMRSEVLSSIGFLDTAFRFAMDFEYWLRLAIAGGKLRYIPHALASARMHADAKTTTLKLVAAEEQLKICAKILPFPETQPALRRQESRIKGSCHRVAAYWAYTAGNASATRHYIGRLLRYPGSWTVGSLLLGFSSLWGDATMQRLRHLWQAQHLSLLQLSRLRRPTVAKSSDI